MVARNAFILEDMKDKAKEEGIKEGIKEGREEGREEGIKKGREEEKLAIARNMKKLGLDIDIIIEATGLSKEEIIEKLNIKE